MKTETGCSKEARGAIKPYDEDYKRNAVELLIGSRRPLKQIARELGITPTTLRQWRDKRGSPTFPSVGKTDQRWSRLTMEAENNRLRDENERLKKQRDILKKALSILSDPPSGSML
jgi:transposase